ncbi:MAG TPA: hypothetical protein VK666_16870, partial [Chryseolinea sp.]|nr:hypothetical protein [Chryseolinea sp.]
MLSSIRDPYTIIPLIRTCDPQPWPNESENSAANYSQHIYRQIVFIPWPYQLMPGFYNVKTSLCITFYGMILRKPLPALTSAQSFFHHYYFHMMKKYFTDFKNSKSWMAILSLLFLFIV